MAISAHHRGSADTDSMQMSMQSDTTQQPLIASPGVVFQLKQCSNLFPGRGRRPPEQPFVTTWHLRFRL